MRLEIYGYLGDGVQGFHLIEKGTELVTQNLLFKISFVIKLSFTFKNTNISLNF